MACVLAVILTSVARMVIISPHYSPHHYGVYTTPKANEFPVPSNYHQIHMSASKIAGPGTYVVAYCSIQISQRKIVEIITGGLPGITQNPGKPSFSNLEAESACFTSIRRENALESVAVPLSKLDNGECTHNIIAILAFKGVISIEGEFSCFAPPQEEQRIKVNADIPFDMQQFLAGSLLLRGEDDVSDERVLVWFQESLHVFKQTKPGVNSYSLWSPIISIGREVNNGKVITNFIYDNLPSIQEFTKIMGDFHNLLKYMKLFYRPEHWELSESNYKKFYRRPNYDYLDDICMLNLGFEHTRCGWINNLPGYLKKPHDLGLLCRTRRLDRTGFVRKRECIFRPAFIRYSKFLSNQWKDSGSKNKMLQIPPQSLKLEKAARLKEVNGDNLCRT
ncbi:BgTH12-02194 [Blumeria graminis f. sp. triticale]|uniref:Bgt-50535 n=2 Tax=Blumeria graminis TaxID=34373 RepID=A0A9X9QC92_BLUGR|nr:BgTH12-02194 [Blumeria graminis f. sp. triticale]VDB85918.1 Bgt-50535 [Blumeria graminis f. sp. tritici]